MPENRVEQIGEPVGLATVLAKRAGPMIHAMLQPAAAMLLIGEAGAGKSSLAEYVAGAVCAAHPGQVRSVVLPRPLGLSNHPRDVFGGAFPEAFREDVDDPDALLWVGETFNGARLAAAILDLARSGCGGAEPLLVLPYVDLYAPHSAAVLEHLIRQGGMRIIATAHRMTGGAHHMARDPRVSQFTVGPLDLDEADLLLAALLGNAHIAPPTLRRWHAATGGNRQALTLMFVANERSGVLKHRQGLARVPLGQDQIPEEIATYLGTICTPEEIAVLEFIALGEPLSETALLRLLDPKIVNALLDAELVSTRITPDGHSALHVTRPIFGSALRLHMSPFRRIDLSERFFDALTADSKGDTFVGDAASLLRAVSFGLDCGRRVPRAWLTAAITRLQAEPDPALMLKVSIALAQSGSDADSAAAALRAAACALQLGDIASLAQVHSRIDELVADSGARKRLPAALLTRLRLLQIERRFKQGAPIESTLAEIDALAASLTRRDDAVAREVLAVHRVRLLLRDGRFADAAEWLAGFAPAKDILIEWVRAPGNSAISLLLQQQGRLAEAIALADRALALSSVGRRPLYDSIELQALQWFLGYWASGSAEGARRAVERIEADAERTHQTGARVSELAETAWAMLALQEARWRDAADLVELIDDSTDPLDPYGLAGLLHAAHALALAALGERGPALAALHRSEEPCRGLSGSYAGFKWRIALQAKQWLRHGDIITEAQRLARWADEQNLALIELQALHIGAMEAKAEAQRSLPRAEELAEQIDPLVAEVILTHIEKIASGASPSDVSEPEVRLLSELGLWVPLPRSPGLSSREREIALLASLGYSSRFISERFHLSVRTVETHLAHSYAKLGLADRAGLREWFSENRSMRSGEAAQRDRGVPAEG